MDLDLGPEGVSLSFSVLRLALVCFLMPSRAGSQHECRSIMERDSSAR